ncbi:RhoGAP-domain-containing protein [Teratosphaeria nubilosa]|uniref:RhoGAP-domain-containing protein n=1 Tax=Teratosphaeria nubilosa TaxID=161662 RepID=A0A6G1LMG4_9PEZI|nr:RhoGAP-domain-containing protein [Teratosphaeria nubilosa]
MANDGPSTAQAGTGGPKPAPLAALAGSESQQQKKDLASWWKSFKRTEKKPQDQQQAPHGIFGVPLQQSIRYANVAISLFNDEGQSYIYGYVPIVVAKCGVYLKEKATDVEGIFRLAGSEKRIKELKVAFDSPDRYGKGLDWTGYTVHDAANILRRYFNQLPEPIIPLEFYESFRQPLRNHQAQAVGTIEAQGPSVGHFDQESAIKSYQSLITELPPLNRQLLLYILDLLAVFASKSDLNKMTTPNLAAIFQPGILSHPQHDMAPQEYRLSQDVLIFLIENQDSFLIGMQGTAADPETVRDVQSGTPAMPSTPTTPGRSKTIIGRSASNASAGAESVRRFGNIRRNVSVSSKHSKRSEGGPTPIMTPGSPPPSTPTSGVHRSNTVPSRRGGSSSTQHSPRFSRDKKDSSDPPTPSPGAIAAAETAPKVESVQAAIVTSGAFTQVQPPEVISASSSEVTTPMAATIASDTSSAVRSDYVTPKKDTTPLLAPPAKNADRESQRSNSNTSSAPSRSFLGILKQSPTSDTEGQERRKPNKLQKKRIPGSALSSAQSSSHSLHEDEHNEPAPRSPMMSGMHLAKQPPADISRSLEEALEQANHATPQGTPVQITPQRKETDTTLRPTASPTHSYHSTDFSDAEFGGDEAAHPNASEPERDQKRHRWRFSRSQNKLDQPQTPTTSNPLGTMSLNDQATSRSTVGSTSQPRRSLQESRPLATSKPDPASATPGLPVQSQQTQPSSTDPVFSDSERERKGPMSWIRGKIQERKDKEEAKRSNTPERGQKISESKQDLQGSLQQQQEVLPVRGKSFEQARAPQVQAPNVTSHPAPAQTVSAAQTSTPVAQPTSGPAASVSADEPAPAPVVPGGPMAPAVIPLSEQRAAPTNGSPAAAPKSTEG